MNYSYWKICQHYEPTTCKKKKKWDEPNPPQVLRIEDVNVLWDFTKHTDRILLAKQTNIMIKILKEKHKFYLVDVTIPSDKKTFYLKNWINFQNTST